jgi:hypothetical protein
MDEDGGTHISTTLRKWLWLLVRREGGGVEVGELRVEEWRSGGVEELRVKSLEWVSGGVGS